MIWFISDTHFGHSNLQWDSHGGRPPKFEELIYRNTTGVFAPDDTLVHCGDVYLGNHGKEMTRQWLSTLPCTKILIRGNHDKESYSAYLRQGWNAVVDGAVFTAYGKSFFVTHKPMEYVSSSIDFNVHGHLHNSGHRGELVNDGRHILLSCEYCDYRPISMKKLAYLASTPAWRQGRWERLVPKEN